MARIRTVKPELWNDAQFVACSPLARLFFIGTWNIADDFGVLKDDPERLQMQLLPRDQVDPFELIDELVKRDLLLRRVAPDGTHVLVIPTFCIHQKIDKRSVGRYGNPADFQPTPPVPTESPPIPPSPTPVKERTGLEGKGFSTPLSSEPSTELELVAGSVSPSATTPVEIVFDAWRESTGHPGAKLDSKRRRVITAALKTYPLDEVVDAVTGWQQDPHSRGENDRHTVYNSLDLVLRDAHHIEKFRDLARGSPSERARFAEPRGWQATRILEGRT